MSEPATAIPATTSLPEVCATRDRVTKRPILIVRGEPGYYAAPADTDPDGFNQRRGITEAQVQAMECGSMWGWDVPGADPATWERLTA